MALKAVLILATVGLVYSQGHTAALLVAEPTMEGTAPAVTKPSTNATSPTPTINSTCIPWKSASSSVTCLPALMPVTGSSTTEQEAWTRAATWLEGHSATRRTSASKMFLTAPVLGFVLEDAQSATPTTYATSTSRLDARRKELNLQRVPEFPPSKAATPS